MQKAGAANMKRAWVMEAGAALPNVDDVRHQAPQLTSSGVLHRARHVAIAKQASPLCCFDPGSPALTRILKIQTGYGKPRIILYPGACQTSPQ